MKTIYALLVSLICSIECGAQPKFQKLLVAEYSAYPSKTSEYSYLTVYNFRNGKFLFKDTLFEGPKFHKEKLTSYANFQGRNFIYKNRYVIGQFGTVIDTKTRKLVGDVHDSFIETRGDTLIYYRNNTITGNGYFALDLKTEAYGIIKDNTWYKPRYKTSSPDNRYYLSVDRRGISYKVCLNDYLGNLRVLVSDAKAGPEVRSTQLPDVETVWLNNNSFIYVVHHRKKSPQNVLYNKVDLRKYNLADSSDQSFSVIDSVPQGSLNGSFIRNAFGDIIYFATSGYSYFVDTVRNKLYEYKDHKLLHDFSRSFGKDGTDFKYKRTSIGTFRARGAFVDNGVVATEYIEKESTNGNARGIKIWTSKTKKWVTFDIPWSIGIIGWLNEDSAN